MKKSITRRHFLAGAGLTLAVAYPLGADPNPMRSTIFTRVAWVLPSELFGRPTRGEPPARPYGCPRPPPRTVGVFGWLTRTA